jgi:hypothetical protein
MSDFDQEPKDWFARNAPPPGYKGPSSNSGGAPSNQPDSGLGWFARNAPPGSTGPTTGSGTIPTSQTDPNYSWFAANAPPSARKPAAVTSWKQDLENDLWGSQGTAGTGPTAGGYDGRGVRPETASFLRDLAGIGTGPYLDMRRPEAPVYQQWRDRNFTPVGSGKFVSPGAGGQAYTQAQLRQMHDLLSRQAGNPMVSRLFNGPKSAVADFMVWRNQNFAANRGTFQDEDGTLYSYPELEKMFADKSQAQSKPAQAPATAGGGAQQSAQPKASGQPAAGLPKQLAKQTALPKALVNQQQQQQLNNMMAGIQNPATRPLGVAQDGSLVVDVGLQHPAAVSAGWPTVGAPAKQQRDQLNALMTGIRSPATTPYGVAEDGSTILDLGSQVSGPPAIPQDPTAPPIGLGSPSQRQQRHTMNTLTSGVLASRDAPLFQRADGTLIRDVRPPVGTGTQIPYQPLTGDYFSNVDIARIIGHEGGTALHANVPPADKDGRWNSGVTIAAGFDLGQQSVSGLKRLGLSQDLINRFTPYLGLHGQDAQDALDKQPLGVSAPEARAINAAVFQDYPDKTGRAFNKARAEINGGRNPDNLALDEQGNPAEFDRLPWQAQTVIADLWYNLGDLSSPEGAPHLWKQVTTGDWEGAWRNLRHFSAGDDVLARRARKDAILLRQAIDNGAMPDY